MVNILIGILLLIAVMYLSQKGVIKSFKFPIIKWRYFENHGKRKLNVSYSRFNGIEKFPFKIDQEHDVAIAFNVSVDAGSVILKCVNGGEVLFDETFHAGEEGTVTFTPRGSIMVVTIIGNYTKGKCIISHEKAPVEADVVSDR